MKLQQKIYNKFSIVLFSAMFFLMLPLICAAQGKILFTTNRDGGNEEIYQMNGDGSNQINLSNSWGDDRDPSLNGSGSKIVFTSYRDNNWEIYTMNANGSNQVNVSNNPEKDKYPSFSYNGAKIVFSSVRANGEDYQIYVMDADGSNPTQLTFANPAWEIKPSFSPDGSKIVFVSSGGDIHVMNSDGSNQVNLTNNAASDTDPAFSHDGSKIVFASDRDGSYEIYTMNADGSDVTRLTNNDDTDLDPTFSPDDSKIAFVSDHYNPYPSSEIFVMNSDGSNMTRKTFSLDWQFNDTPFWGRKPGHRFKLLTFSDLLSPDAEPNVIRAGINVPIDFSLDGFQGNNVYRLPPTSQRIDCSTRRPTAASETINRTQPDVVYYTGLEYYSTTWLTQTTWKGTCRRLSLYLDDGSTEMVDFYFQ